MKPGRFRLPKITISVFTLLLLGILVSTLIIKPNCDSIYFTNTYAIVFGAAILVLQLFLNWLSWRSESKILILAALFISTMILGAAMLQFIGILKVCL